MANRLWQNPPLLTNDKLVAKKLTTGDIMVFDKKDKHLYLIDSAHTQVWLGDKDQSVQTVEQMAKNGQAQRFDHDTLAILQEALAGVVLLV